MSNIFFYFSISLNLFKNSLFEYIYEKILTKNKALINLIVIENIQDKI